jgi:hypothetical protein
MVLHDFLSRCLMPLQDLPAHPAWVYTGVNDIMRLERGPRSSLDHALLAACLKTLTTDQFSADLMVLAVVCKPICMNQAARTALLAIMPHWTTSNSLRCRGATSPTAWSSPGQMA